MALTSGTRLGPYEVTAQIGVGGMGEVYRATDTKLKHEVAVKVLPSHVAADPERLARFQREAEVLASLNHPEHRADPRPRRVGGHQGSRHATDKIGEIRSARETCILNSRYIPAEEEKKWIQVCQEQADKSRLI